MIVEKHNVEEMLIMEKEDYWKKANKEGDHSNMSKTFNVCYLREYMDQIIKVISSMNLRNCV